MEIDAKTAWLIMIIFYGIDCLLLTPYILWKGLGTEAGLLMSWGYERMGLIWFPIWFIVFSYLLYLVLQLVFIGLDWILKEDSKYPKWALVITWSVLTVWAIINNLRFA
ncbi:MAG TPA: hypothetical protein VMZ91_02225 [Candidatus Paceibacterota bacterium]|nr:hypothetical protein [Candidatus Paceibacterota bacterium]